MPGTRRAPCLAHGATLLAELLQPACRPASAACRPARPKRPILRAVDVAPLDAPFATPARAAVQ